MHTISLIKNIAIILDFIISIIASAIKTSMPEVSNMLFGISAFVLIIAVICVVVEFVNWKLKK